MGMYDDVEIVDPRITIACDAGHRLTQFQTKDFENAMDRYYVYDRRLFRYRYMSDTRERVRFDLDPEQGNLFIRHTSVASPHGFTGAVQIYAHCETCLPVLYIGEYTSVLNEAVHERQPWCEFSIQFIDGKYVAATSVRVESREGMIAELTKNGVLVLKDDETIAKRHFTLRQQNRNRKRDGQDPEE